jgi:DNA mismatch endonuclease (patch repair protein)
MREKWKERKFLQKNNTLELTLQERLIANRINFNTHVSIEGRPDIFIDPNICIFVDGCYWHGCPCKFNPEQKGQHSEYIKSRIKHDEAISEELKNKGFVVLRFWEHEIKNNIDYCLEKINSNIMKPTN